MLKMYHRGSDPGGSPAYWDETWDEVDLGEALRYCEVDPLRPLFERFARPGSRMLEGGCGVGQNVIYYSARGVDVVGLDFALDTLVRLRALAPHLKLCCGDVSALPFADESFDVYYSGGVVEHFEGGAEEALREARRVLNRRGVLLVSVPYLSPLRRAIARGRPDWRRVASSSVDEAGAARGREFYQYAYTRREFERVLAAAGLRVVQTQGYAIFWGMREAPVAGRIIEALQRRLQRRAGAHGDGAAGDSAGGAAAAPAPPSQAAGGGAAPASLLKRLAVAEDDTVPVAGLAVRALRWACANMMMYVCVRDDYEGTRGCAA